MTDTTDRFLRRFARSLGIEEDPQDLPEPTPPTGHNRPGTLTETPHGEARVIQARVATCHPYNIGPVTDLLVPATTAHARYLKDERVRDFQRDGALFLDTETTGLSHGAGTVAFLVGLAWFEGEKIVVEQLLLDDYDQEQAQLDRLLEHLSRSRFLVSYNGKSFDRSVLENRLVVHRFMDRKEAHLRLQPHLDLLHVGRRIYKGLLPNHRLPTLEHEILDFHRPDDLPGELAPQHFFQYLLSGNGDHIAPVLTHNFDDVLSLVHLADTMLRRLNPGWLPESPVMAANLGRLYAQTQADEPARRCLEAALAPPSHAADEAVKLARILARVYRRQHLGLEHHEALWQRLAAAFPEAPEPLIELAIVAQKQRDRAAALRYAEKALQLAPDDEAIRKRVVRLHQ